MMYSSAELGKCGDVSTAIPIGRDSLARRVALKSGLAWDWLVLVFAGSRERAISSLVEYCQRVTAQIQGPDRFNEGGIRL
jgi:hypothetical protein